MFESIVKSIQRRQNLRRYKKLSRCVERPKNLTQNRDEGGYFSQYGQDKWVAEVLFPGLKEGVFVDIGANDGVFLSNTYALERMGWTGLAIEPIPSVYGKLSKNRSCQMVNGCIAPEDGKKIFRSIHGYSEMLSGLVDEYDPCHLERIERELSVHGGTYEDIEVNCYNFNDLLDRHSISYIDYLNIDVEGVELKILQSIDFDRIHIKFMGVENNYKDCKIPDFLASKGFEFHSIVGDEFYRNMKDLKS